MVDVLGHIPEQGERAVANWENIEFTVLSAEDNKIEKVRAVIKDRDDV